MTPLSNRQTQNPTMRSMMGRRPLSARDELDEGLDRFDSASDAAKDRALSVQHPYTFEYRPEAIAMGMPRGRMAGVMAQDLERAPLSREVVHDTPRGKMLSVPKALSLNLALTGRLAERLDELEARRR